MTEGWVLCLAISGTSIFAGTSGGGIYHSTDNGTSWTEVNNGLTYGYVRTLKFLGTSLFAGTWGGGVYISTDNGTSWTASNVGLTATDVYSLATSDMNLFAGTKGNSIFLSTDNGVNWTWTGIGLITGWVLSLAVLDTNLFAGSYDHVWRRPLSEMITDVEPDTDLIIADFSLQQNFPNPFNPSTRISWQVPEGGWQTLKVYDLLGNEVATLVDQYKPAGKYEVEYDASSLTSGVYFYQLKAENYIETKKMVLLK